MLLTDYYRDEDGLTWITPHQASMFAKKVANDFNPIHDADDKRFCVPGDLLFSLVLEKYGLNQDMHFRFLGMVGKGVPLVFPDGVDAEFEISDKAGKKYLKVDRSGENSKNPVLIDNVIRQYVEFSGQTFPHILVPMMKEQQVMINPDRPLVIYEDMRIYLRRFDLLDVSLVSTSSSLQVDGKRGKATLAFELLAGGQLIGTGEKNMVLSGLREYDQKTIDALIQHFNDRKVTYR